MNRPIHFEIPASDPEKTIQFYSAVFGWTFHKWDGPMPYWLVSTGPAEEPGINGGMMPRHHPEQPCVNTMGVESVDATIAKALAAGGAIALPKQPIPGIGWLAYLKDTDGHIFGVMENDPKAGV